LMVQTTLTLDENLSKIRIGGVLHRRIFTGALAIEKF
jgi:hypothetical protein